MALAFEVSDSKEIAYAIAAHDEYLSYLAFAISDRDNEWTIDPTHEFYSLPYCLMRRAKDLAVLIFTPQVPWLSGNPQVEETQCHRRAQQWQKKHGNFDPPEIDRTVEELQDQLKVGEADMFTFTKGGYYPQEYDTGLEIKAFNVSCAVMGWKIPSNWQDWRRREGPKNKWKHMMMTLEEYEEALRERAAEERAAEKGLAMARIRNGDEDDSTDAGGPRESTRNIDNC
ncbi:hypothetical protein THAOC_16635 [Thalassiosira oceanica]|uniref:Uncharacterized protein n=1 Tax=Thalassiosira oceanica TaxID=159749 RepID=K0SP58_THAOC|nr:hypothetical protein THAOC_16635 [Thalassiosira oceanica]|mmetsp:Transcript_28340/g.67539  ORF Transcript_28340/g.67539 Transcript_28340/m.67539 type:complete len:228 (+) Transcript_28340:380-1063(+)|eukprot:EJK62741.1 hypothetical protein THAOC_16635 [Thalassiosira oceanica]